MKKSPKVKFADVLFEIGTEEIPARFLPNLRRLLKTRLEDRLKKAQLGFTAVESFATPRRLVAVVRGVPERQTVSDETVLGPAKAQAFDASGKPTPAVEGFARKHGVAVARLIETPTEKGVRMAVILRRKPEPAAVVLARELGELLAGGLEVPKAMRWPQAPGTFARPVRWLLALHGSAVIPVTLGAIRAGRTTMGRRFVHPAPVAVKSAAEYFKILAKLGIVIDAEERRTLIRREAEKLASTKKGRVLWDEALLGEVADLVEAPRPVLGTYPVSSLEVPQPVVVAAMQEHQRYFPVGDAAGALLPYFITVANGVRTPSVVAGNERVLKARLADARFFFETDRKHRLEERLPALAGVVWQAGAGSMLEKAKRMQALSAWLAVRLGVKNPAILQAALLAKADLVTAMVGEFPTLQGVVGGIYATASGEREEVAVAIGEHYRPTGPSDDVPSTPVGCVVALADKLDHLAGHFVLGHAPTGTADPYAMRRAALGVIRILFDRHWHLPLRETFTRAADRLATAKGADASKAAAEALGFVRGRLAGVFEEQGFAPDEIAAVLAGFDDVSRAAARLRALAVVKSRPGFREAVQTLSRVTNILPKGFAGAPVDAAALAGPEAALHAAHAAIADAVAAHEAAGEFEALWDRLLTLSPSIAAFFDGVMVMDPDESVKTRRLSLLKEIDGSIRKFADVRQLVIQ